MLTPPHPMMKASPGEQVGANTVCTHKPRGVIINPAVAVCVKKEAEKFSVCSACNINQ